MSPTALLRPAPLFAIAALLRVGLLLYGTWQDAHSALKYTDIDYLVFTDAARLVWHGGSPYDRDTYRYTPLLAWILAPTAAPLPGLFSAGKVLFALADLVAGWLMLRILLVSQRLPVERAGAFAAIWLWNPMVATISTRGSSEGLLGVLTVAVLWAVGARRFGLAGAVLGLAVHLKIYPFIYAPAIVWWMDESALGRTDGKADRKADPSSADVVVAFFSRERITLAATSLATFFGLNLVMYCIYGQPFLVHTFLHHLSRLDHRHNFSPYNILLYLTSASAAGDGHVSVRAESLAFIPQLLLSCVLIPLLLAKKDLATSMLAQTFAFVTFNKVCTSQYFLWYMVFLPLYLPRSSLLRSRPLGLTALVLWVATQASWLQQGYELEFLGESTFFPGLWIASLSFFLVNCWILAIIITDGATGYEEVKAHTE
ncbi:GPI mannosyltransferase 1 subunit M [Geosmithia morbida]|uniref:GPI mannosyltransferase 1 n=1 Tax=Geosmithia morbida TaxID=1094350 RepID=A0A9P4Z017_9HYPO|nr:GPI mannosyltransferase 1 subunit M [Geosmithia morbida]KAF4124927.1 GPI mannosyltransferase 1 subunit M [Geosmithia morbida]